MLILMLGPILAVTAFAAFQIYNSGATFRWRAATLKDAGKYGYSCITVPGLAGKPRSFVGTRYDWCTGEDPDGPFDYVLPGIRFKLCEAERRLRKQVAKDSQ